MAGRRAESAGRTKASRRSSGAELSTVAAHREAFHARARQSSRSSEGRIATFSAQDGLRLAARIFDAPHSRRLPLLCLSGLSRNSRDFLALGSYFSCQPSEARKVVALDYRGRGLSARDRNWQNYAPLTEARDVLAAAAVFGLERAIIVGTSRGGIIAMMLGALRPGLLAGVVLNDIGPVIEGTGLARIKTYLKAARRMRNWSEAVNTLRQVAGARFPGLSEADWRAFAEAFYRETPKGLEPDFDRNLLKTLQSFDFTDAIPTLWPQFDSLRRIPLLSIRGEHSDILSARTLQAMTERHPFAETLTVRGQGHAPLLRDADTLARIAAFVSDCELLGSEEPRRVLA